MARRQRSVQIDGFGAVLLRIPTKRKWQQVADRWPNPEDQGMRVAECLKLVVPPGQFEPLAKFLLRNPSQTDDAADLIIREVGHGMGLSSR